MMRQRRKRYKARRWSRYAGVRPRPASETLSSTPKYLRDGYVSLATIMRWAALDAKDLDAWDRRMFYQKVCAKVEPELVEMLRSDDDRVSLRGIKIYLRLKREYIRFVKKDLRYVGELMDAVYWHKDSEAKDLFSERLDVGDSIAIATAQLLGLDQTEREGVRNMEEAEEDAA